MLCYVMFVLRSNIVNVSCNMMQGTGSGYSCPIPQQLCYCLLLAVLVMTSFFMAWGADFITFAVFMIVTFVAIHIPYWMKHHKYIYCFIRLPSNGEDQKHIHPSYQVLSNIVFATRYYLSPHEWYSVL